MKEHRRSRLVRLAQGSALVGAGIAQFACGNEAPPPVSPPSHVDSPMPVDAGVAPEGIVTPNATPSSSDAGPVLKVAPLPPVHMNAPPMRPLPPKP